MGSKRVSVRTLKSGEKVEHHPNEELYLLNNPQSLVNQLKGGLGRREMAGLSRHRREKIERHRARLERYRSNDLPEEKKPL